jgi:hypothetical protein
MTQSCRIEGAWGNLLVPPMTRADAQHRRQRPIVVVGALGGNRVSVAPKPKAQVAAMTESCGIEGAPEVAT